MKTRETRHFPGFHTKNIANTLSTEVNKCYRKAGLSPTKAQHKKRKRTDMKLSSSKQSLKGFASAEREMNILKSN